MWQTERERGEGIGTDGGSERVEDTGETDHLRSVGRQHKPVGEGRSPLDSVLQRDEKRDREGEVTKWKMKTRETKRTRSGQRRHKEKYRENVKEQDRNWLSCRAPSGGKITQGVGENLGCHISQFFKMPVRPRCLHQILTTCQTNHFVVHYNCSCLCIMQKRGVCVCQFVRSQSQTTLRS